MLITALQRMPKLSIVKFSLSPVVHMYYYFFNVFTIASQFRAHWLGMSFIRGQRVLRFAIERFTEPFFTPACCISPVVHIYYYILYVFTIASQFRA